VIGDTGISPASPAPATRLLLARHAEVDNARQVLYGRLPRFALSPAGRQQAERLALALAREPVAAIYSGPLLRARQTAGAIARHHPAATRHVSTLLHEVRSAWEGTPLASFATGFSTYGDPRAPDDETMAGIAGRMLRFVARVHRRHPGACVVAISHGDPITILRVALRGWPLTLAAIRGRDYADLCSVTEVVWEPGAERPVVTYAASPEPGAGSR
jgi:probable phosphoglycerate mutase